MEGIRQKSSRQNHRQLSESILEPCATKLNPADIATRGVSTKTLIESALWQNEPDCAEISNQSREIDERCLSYLTKPKIGTCLSVENAHDLNIIESHSSFYKLIRIFSTIRAIF